jgi:hypothetical protein
VDNLDQIIIIVNNQPNGPHSNNKPHFDFKQYFKTKKLLVNDNYKLIEEHDFFKELCKLVVTNLVGWGGFVWNVVGSRKTCYN